MKFQQYVDTQTYEDLKRTRRYSSLFWVVVLSGAVVLILAFWMRTPISAQQGPQQATEPVRESPAFVYQQSGVTYCADVVAYMDDDINKPIAGAFYLCEGQR